MLLAKYYSEKCVRSPYISLHIRLEYIGRIGESTFLIFYDICWKTRGFIEQFTLGTDMNIDRAGLIAQTVVRRDEPDQNCGSAYSTQP